MKEYPYFYDEKIITWKRNYFTVEAEDEESANEKAKDIILEEDLNWDLDIYDSEYIDDLSENMTPEENEGNSTIELYSDTDESLLYKNGL